VPLWEEPEERDRFWRRAGYSVEQSGNQGFPVLGMGHQLYKAQPRRRSSSPRPSRARSWMHRWRNSDSRSPTLISHGATARRELTDISPELAQWIRNQYFGLTLADTPTSCRKHCSQGCARCSRRVHPGRRSGRPTTGSTAPLSSSWKAPAGAGSEEYLNSEKYQVRHWRLDRPDSLRSLIAPDEPRAPPEPRAAIGRIVEILAGTTSI